MLTEIAKLDAVRAAGLPDAAKASSHRPQATLVTQPKIAAPCEDDPGDTAERPFGFGRDGQPADPGVAPDRRVRARLSRGFRTSAIAATAAHACGQAVYLCNAAPCANARICRRQGLPDCHGDGASVRRCMPHGAVIRTAKLITSHAAEGERREPRPGRSGCRRCPRSGSRAANGHQPRIIQRARTRQAAVPGNAAAEPAAAAARIAHFPIPVSR
jgi:hypothetical protein